MAGNAQKREIERLKAEIDQKNTTIHNLNQTVWDNLDEAASSSTTISTAGKDLTNKINTLNEQISSLSQKEADYLHQIEKLRSLVQQQDLERSNTKEYVESLENELASLSATLSNTDSSKTELGTKLQERQQEVEKLQNELQCLSFNFQNQMQTLSSKCHSLELSNNELQSELVSQKENFTRLQKQMTTAESLFQTEYQIKLEENRKMIEIVANERDGVTVQLQLVQQQFEHFKTDSDKRITEFESQISILKDSVEKSFTEKTQLHSALEIQRQELESFKQAVVKEYSKKVNDLEEYITTLDDKLQKSSDDHEQLLHDIHEKEQELKEKEHIVSNLHAEREQLQISIRDLQTKNVEVTEELASSNRLLQEQQSNHKNEIIALQSTIVKLSTEMTSKLDKLDTLSRNEETELKKELQDKIEILKKELHTQEIIIDKMGIEADELRQKIRNLQELQQKNTEIIEAKNNEMSNIQMQLTDLTAQYNELRQEKVSLLQSIEQKETDVSNLNKELEKLQSNFETNSTSDTKMKETISNLTAELNAAKSTLKEKILELAKTTETRDSLLQENKKLNEYFIALKKVEKENNKLYSEKDSLQLQISQLQSQLTEAHQQLENRNGNGFENSIHEDESIIKNLKYELELLKEENKTAKQDNNKKDIEILNLQTIINELKSQNTTNGSAKETKLEVLKQEASTVKTSGRKKEKGAQQPSSQEANQTEFSQPTTRTTRNSKRKLEKTESSEKDSSVDSQQVSPPKKQKTEKTYMFSFSNRNQDEKQKFKEIIEKLGGVILEEGAKYDPRTTHLLTGLNSNTIKTIAASLSCKWIIRKPEEWLQESSKQGHFVEETSYGHRNTESSLKNKKICLIVSSNKSSQASSATQIVKEYGNCTLIPADQIKDADMVVYWDKEKPSNSPKKAKVISWDEFLKMIHNESGEN